MKGNIRFAERIKLLREKYGDSQESLASLFGYSKQAVSNWEVSGKVPRNKVLEKLAERYNTSSDYLLGFTEDPTPSTGNKLSNETKAPKDLVKILAEHEIMFSGTPLDEEDKKEIYDLIQFRLFRRAKELNKRKPKDKED